MSGILITQDGIIWSSYSEPLVLSEQGESSVGYCAEDKAGNVAVAASTVTVPRSASRKEKKVK